MRIAVRAANPKLAQRAQEYLAGAGIEAVASVGAASAAEGEDVVIVVAAERQDAAALAQAIRHGARAPLAVLAGLALDAPLPSGLERAPDFCGAVALDAPPALLLAQISAASRASVAREERSRRMATAASIEIAPPKPYEPRLLKALYIGAPSPMFLSLEHAFAREGGLVCAAFSSFAGFDHLHDEHFDAVVLNGAGDAVTAVALCAALRRNASLHHMPTLMVTQPGDQATARAAIERGAAAIVESNAPSAAALGWLFEAIRRERDRAAAEHDIRALRDVMGNPRTGLFRPDAFDAHLARLARDHHASGRPLSLAILRVIPAHGARQPAAQAWTRGFDEIASLASRLVRDADCGAPIGAEFIVLALSATERSGAKRTAERVASVGECTAFASGEGGTGPIVFEQNAVELQPGESGAALLARGLRAFEPQHAAFG